MPEPELTLLFTRRLDALGARYMVSGSVAVSIYGAPRLTNDVDLIVVLDRAQSARLPEVFAEAEFYLPPPEAIALPARQPDAERVPEPIVREEPPVARKPEPKEPEQAQPQPQPAAPAAMPSVSTAEASPGTVRLYALAISKVLDARKPRSRGLRGQVRVQFVVDTGGRPEPPVVLASSGIARLDEIVLEAIRQMEFPPPPREMSLRQRTFNVPFAFR